ncbi:uncharacterized protein FIBRA_07287 [Fibroporia radiculosa]|uniref:adenosine deaminase n=1 Tax=Fibroporia radiculosa TaxID=599839 RepID=J4GUM9_9APHY|nr:uncharacterized protein FIBRA_07287 [Fibroporia radiculosa]CCM05080.1 predicted protein [Fibroporia radiculosa]
MGFKDEVAYDQHMDMLHLPLTANPSPALSARSINETDFSQIQSLPVSPLPRPIPTSQPQTVHSSPETPASDVLVHFASNGIPPTNHVPRAVSEPSLRSISSLGKPSPVQTAQQFQPSPAVSQRTLREPNGDSAQIIVSGRSSSITSMSLFSVPSAPASADGSYRQSPSAISTSVMTPRASVFPASSDQVEVGSSVGKASEYFGVETRNSPSTVASRSPAISPRSILGMSLGPTTFRRPAVRQSITGDSSSYSSSGMSSASSRPPPDRSASVSSVSPAGNTTDTDLTVHDMPKPSVPIPIVSSTPPKSLSWHCRLCMKDPHSIKDSRRAMSDEYFARRQQLIQEDRARRVDTNKLQRLTNIEKRADNIVRSIRSAEAVSVWGTESTTIFDYTPDDTTPNVFPGMAFLTGRDIVMKTRLFQILSKMPKGALLHAHLDATVNVRVLIELALGQPALHVRSPASLTANNIRAMIPEFKALPADQFSNLISLTDQAYPRGGWVPFYKARETFDPALGGPAGFDDWVVRALMINPLEAYGTHNTTTKIWAKFTSTFRIGHPLVYFMPIWHEYIRRFIWSSIEDGISYVEARINFLAKYMTGPDGEENVPHREWLIAFDAVVNEVKVELRRQGREDEFVGAKIIYTTIRSITCEELNWYLEDCLALKKEFPHLIAGFDLVGHEDSLKPLIDYIEPLAKFVERQKEVGVHVPFIFHAGETLGDGSAADMNLYDAILLGTKRIGHGFSLVKHPRLMDICREKGIAIEVCPISNEILRLTSSMPMHPLPVLVNHGVHVSLCSDDPAVFGNMGLSFDFFQVLVASEVTGLITAGEFARDSIKHSMLAEDEKANALALWEKQWQKYLSWVVEEFVDVPKN